MYYFGCIGRPGHYLWDQQLRRLWQTPRHFPLSHYEILDGGFLPPGEQEQGRVVIWRTSGWAIASFWDRSVDTRHGCSSSFVLECEDGLSDTAIMDRCRAAFPTIFARFTFAVSVPDYEAASAP